MMDNWQFFLQKEGDYAWLPLETPQVEILEGRYQLVAHTQAAGSSVHVSIRHQYEQEDIPQENIQESLRQADLTGKVEILPSVYLGLGSWSISCQPSDNNEASDSGVMENTSHALEIQVLPQDFDLFEEWQFGGEAESEASAQHPSFLPEEVSLADIAAVDAPEGGAEKAAVNQDMTSTYTSASTDKAAPERPSRFEPDHLILPTFSADTPIVEFRTVSSKELPRLVSDKVPLEIHHSPQLPPFSRSKSIFKTKQEQRSGALSKIKFIASVVSHQDPARELPRQTRRERFQSKLTRIAVGSQ